jgi:hypothetical protein
MPLSFRNIIDANQLSDALTSGDFSKVIKKRNQNLAKYVKGYAEETAIEALANRIDPEMNLDLFKQALGIEKKELDAYDPYHTSDAKKEEFWSDMDGKTVQREKDKPTDIFKRNLFSNAELGGYRQTDFWYEDPFLPSFEIYFNEDSPLFVGDDSMEERPTPNSLKRFMLSYIGIDPDGYQSRFNLWKEFKKVFFKIFDKEIERGKNIKPYYIAKLSGLDNLNKKMIKYGEDKITITLNEDVAMFSYYLSELYNNLVYSYRNQRFAFPENVMRFECTIKINDIRKFQVPESSNSSAPTNPSNEEKIDEKNLKYVISDGSYILYKLHDCNFNFFESRNYQNDLEIGGYSSSIPNQPQSLSFDIFFKSVTRSSIYPLIDKSLSIDAYNSIMYSKADGTLPKYMQDLDRIKKEKEPEEKGYLNQLLAKGVQTVVNAAANYTDNLETKLREVRGSAVNGLLQQFRNVTNINKIEPDNVYTPDFNNRASVANAAKGLGSTLLNNLEETTRGAFNI